MATSEFFFYYNETHYNTSHLNIKGNFTGLIQYKTRYEDPYIQPEECKGNNNKQTKKQTFE